MNSNNISATHPRNWLEGTSSLRNERTAQIVFALILSVVVLINVTGFTRGSPWGDDYAAYITQARGVAEGAVSEVTQEMLFRDRNSDPEARVGPVLYPWGFPVQLSPVYALYDGDLTTMKVFVYSFYVLSLGILYFLFRSGLPPWDRVVALSLLCFLPYIFSFKNLINSDLPFLFWCLLALLCIQSFIVRRSVLIHPLVDLALLGMAMFMAVVTRTHGIVLLPTLLAAMVVRPVLESLPGGRLTGLLSVPETALRGLRVRDLVPFVIFTACWAAWSWMFAGAESSYAGHLGQGSVVDVVKGVIWRGVLYSYLPKNLLELPWWPGVLLNGLILLPLMAYGIVRRFKQDYVYVAFCAAYMAVLLVYPAGGNERFILPVVPFYFYFSCIGARELSGLLGSRLPRFVPPLQFVLFIPLALWFAGLTVNDWRAANAPDAVHEGLDMPDSVQLLNHIETNLPKDAVLNFWKPRALALYSRRPAILQVEAQDIIQSPADYLIVYKHEKLGEVNARMIRGLSEKPEAFAAEFSNSSFDLYRISR
jgi:hypothetical protein